jgi:sigma-B regulation protein RsbU (phosphoserine phosphatase)
MNDSVIKIKSLSYDDMQRILITRQIELNSLLEITQAINNNLSAEALFKMYQFVLRFHLHVNKLALFIANEKDWECVIHFGVEENVSQLKVDENLIRYQEINDLEDHPNEILNDFDIVIPVYHKARPLAFALIGGFSEADTDSRNGLKFIRTITNLILVANENKKLFKEQIKQEKLSKELELAAKVQTMLIPDELPSNEKIQLSALYLPHQNIGGDYYDFIRLNESEFIFCIADVSGKGVGAALIMSNLQAYMRALVQQDFSLEKLVSSLNANVLKNTKGERFITLFLGRYNCETRKLDYINAGHNPPQLFQKNKIVELTVGCTILGMFDELPKVETGSVKLDKKALLVAYTDGLIEMDEFEGDSFDDEDLSSFIKENHALDLDDFNSRLMANLDPYKQRNLLIDDITLLSFRAL